MADTQQEHRSSSVLYALGRLEEQLASHAGAIKEIPIRVMEVITPKLLMVEDHEKRIRALEVQRWMFAGGLLVAVTVVGWIVELNKG